MDAKDVQWLLAEKYNGNKTADFERDCYRLEHDEPLAYIIGHQPFLNTTIFLDSKPLIPRTETEYWVAQVLKNLPTHPTHILDLCAGSGCIGVAVAIARPLATIDFAEINPVHIPTIQKNIDHAQIAGRSRVFVSDLFKNVPQIQSYDYIFTNPPYIDPALDRTQASVKNFEPHEALYSEHNGLSHIYTIIDQAPSYLTKNGTLYIEHEPEQVTQIAERAKSAYTVHTNTDQYGVLRYSTLVLR